MPRSPGSPVTRVTGLGFLLQVRSPCKDYVAVLPCCFFPFDTLKNEQFSSEMESTVGPGKSEILRCPGPPKVSVAGSPVCVGVLGSLCSMCACGVCGAPRMYTWYKCGTCTETGCRWSRTNASPAVTAEAAMSAGPWPKYPLPPERLPPMSQAQQRVEEPPGGDRRPSWCQSQCRSQGAAPASPCSWEERPPPGRWRGLLEAGAKGGPKRKGVCRGWAQAGRQPQGAPSHLPALALRSVCC